MFPSRRVRVPAKARLASVQCSETSQTSSFRFDDNWSGFKQSAISCISPSRVPSCQRCAFKEDDVTSYQHIASSNNLDFVPLIFESSGKIQPETISFLDSILEAAADGDKKRLGGLKRFWYHFLFFFFL